MKLLALINAQSVLAELSNCKTLSAVTAFRIAKNLKLFENEVKVFEEQRAKMLKELAEKDEDGEAVIEEVNGQNQYKLSDDNKEKLAEELSKILDEEVNVEFKKIELEQLENANLSPNQLNLIDFMINEE